MKEEIRKMKTAFAKIEQTIQEIKEKELEVL